MVGCTSSEINYNKDTKVLICTQPYKSIHEVNGEIVDENYQEGVMERTFWVKDGLLVKSQITYITPITEFEDVER